MRSPGFARGGYAVALLMASSVQAGQAADDDLGRLGDLSIEQLMSESVTSVSRREESLFNAAAAISVLSNDDLRRSGATTVAEALRLVPGMDMAAVNASQPAISARGFNGLYANKLLVLVDGRAVYSALFGGVFWDLQQMMLEDVDRIEVIRGPGATIWGANAVNGVINVVTRDARDTQGGLAYGGGGNAHRALVGGRDGGRLGDDTDYRVFGSYWNNADFPLANGDPAGDAWEGWQGGFRLDRHAGPDTHLTWQAQMTGLDLNDGRDDAYNLNTLGRWARNESSRSGIELQAYYDRTHRNESERARETTDTADLAFHQTLGLGGSNDLVWGLGYRFTGIVVQQTTPVIRIVDEDTSLQVFSAFVQDDWKVVPDTLDLSAGIKLEHNDFTGFELEPSVRATLKPAQRQTLWAAVSRAVRNPSVAEGRDVVRATVGAPFIGPGGTLYVPTSLGNPSVKSEVLLAYELGYRIQPAPRLNVDVATFYNDYSRLIGFGGVQRFDPGTPTGTAEIPASNNGSAWTWGGEIVATLAPADSLRLVAGYSLLVVHARQSGGTQVGAEGAPRHQASLRASYDFATRASLDTQLRYVGPIAAVPGYVTADLGVSYRPSDRLELALVGQNLLDDQHPEQAATPFVVTSEVPRGAYAKLTWRF